MKISLKIFKIVVFFALFSNFYSCQENEILIENENQTYHLKTSRISIKQVLNEINTAEIKEKLHNRNFDFSVNNSLLRPSDSEVYFIKKEKDDELTSYILHLNSYSQLRPYFLKLIITKNNNETERMGYIKYIPTSPTTTLDMATFSGKVQILDTAFEINASSVYQNGVLQQSKYDNSVSNRIICTDEIVITEVKCSRTGSHGVGGTCYDSNYNPIPSDAYYMISLFTRCTGDRTTPTQIIEDYANGNNGGALSVNVGLALAENFANTQLTPEQKLIYYSNPSIVEYLANNVIVVPVPNYNPLLGGDSTMVVIKPEAEEFIMKCIEQMMQNPNVFNSITSFLIEKQIDDSQLDPCHKNVFQQIKNTTNNDFAKVLAKLGDTNTVYNTNMISAVAPDGGIGQTIRNSAFNYTIYISTDYSDKTKLMIASTMLHEFAHAYFFSLIDDCYLQYNCVLLSTFPELWEFYVSHSKSQYPSNPDLHHEAIANSYVNAIASALQEYQPGLPQQVYDDMAWAGLNNTPIFDTKFPVGNPNRERILNRGSVEQSGYPVAQGTPQEQINYGQPCN